MTIANYYRTMMIPKALNLNGVGSSIHDSLVNRNDSLYVESIDSLRLLPSFFDLGEDETEKDLIGRCSKAQSEDNFETATVCDEREILLYLIGHGESELQSLRDAKLSDVGRSDAQHAGKRLSKMEQPPSCVLVSPLALETANIVFPEHPNLQVRYDLSERGMPPHKRSSSLRRAFRRLREESLSSLEASDSLEFSDSEHSDEQHNELYRRKHDRSEGRDFRLIRRLRDENREELRKRTQRLLTLLGESVDTSVAVVTHKGYLRELENGPLGQTDVQEFDNCEARVYRLVLSTNRLVVAKRVR